jgi:hypothetical protein
MVCDHQGGRWMPLSELFRAKPDENAPKPKLLDRLKSKVIGSRDR